MWQGLPGVTMWNLCVRHTNIQTFKMNTLNVHYCSLAFLKMVLFFFNNNRKKLINDILLLAMNSHFLVGSILEGGDLCKLYSIFMRTAKTQLFEMSDIYIFNTAVCIYWASRTVWKLLGCLYAQCLWRIALLFRTFMCHNIPLSSFNVGINLIVNIQNISTSLKKYDFILSRSQIRKKTQLKWS